MLRHGQKCVLFAAYAAFLSISFLAGGPFLVGAVHAEDTATDTKLPANTPTDSKSPETKSAEVKPSNEAKSTDTPEEAIQKARVEANRKRFPDAKLIIKQAIAANPKNIPLYMELYETCVKANDWSDASASLEKVMEIDPAKEKDVYVDYGKTLFQLHRYDKAKAAFKKALGFGKDKDEIHKTLIQIAIREKDEPAEIQEYREYFKIKPNDGDMHWELANLLYGKGKGLKESLPEYKAASENRPMNSYGHERYAYLLLCNKDYEGSVNAYIKAIKVASGSDVSRLNGALKYARQLQKQQNGPAPAAAPPAAPAK